ncbi:MAG: hypothetical protein K8R46_12890, partial [Pirellulales bacterium]|nr:hypothetical protein [Pirellulales bacterium]
MANVEDENPNIDELKTPGEETAAEEPVLEGEAAPADEVDEQLQPVEAVDEAEVKAEETEEGEEEKAEESEKEEAEKEAGKLPLVVELAGVIGAPAVLLALFWFEIIFFSTAIFLIGISFIPYGIWKGRKSNTVFTVFLGCTLAALMTAAYCLWVEMGRYRFDFKAHEAKQRVGMLLPVER